MITGIPHVTFLKYLISVGRHHGSLLSFPITLFSEAATMKLITTDKNLLTNLKSEIRNPKSIKQPPGLLLQGATGNSPM